jgi:hypothetical protein
MPGIPDFAALEGLRKYLEEIRQAHVSTMMYYRSEDGRGFFHQPNKKQEASLSSSATCIASLVHSGNWTEANSWWAATDAIAQKLIEKPWMSAGLDENNPFSVSFIAEGVLDLQLAWSSYERPWADYPNADSQLKVIQGKAKSLLIREIETGSIHIDKYPPSAYLTQLVFRVLSRLEGITPPLAKKVHDWSFSEITKQIALISAKSRLGDPLNLAYALIAAIQSARDEETPEEKELYVYALDLLFQVQNEDGSWPSSQPLFHYPKVGNAHCYEYELLTQLLICAPLRDGLLQYIPQIAKAAYLLQVSKFDIAHKNSETVVAWASGHHPQLHGPESWSTASVYHFVYALDRLVAEAMRRVTFQELGAIYSVPVGSQNPANPKKGFAKDLLDADLELPNGQVKSLRGTVAEQLVYPIARETKRVSDGGSLGKKTPMSAILFGPPGVSKTRLATDISEFLGWPLLMVDPSYLVQKGLDRVQAQANHLFNMLTAVEQVVVLLDEFDEMGRDRSRSQELLSRFITTAMLPKLVSINEKRKIVFLLATNFISGFDAAFSRGGRFDLLFQVMPPSVSAKFGRWDQLKRAYAKLSPGMQKTAQSWLAGDLSP